MKPVSGKRMAKILESKGWTLQRITGSHHYYASPDGQLKRSVPVHGHRDLATGTQRELMRTARIDESEL